MIVIKEVLPNPVGSDEEGEWIRIINDATESAPAKGLAISDESGKTFSLSGVGTMAPGETVELPRSLTKIALNNDGDTVFLRNSKGEVIDQLSYTASVGEGEVVTAGKFLPEMPERADSLSAREVNFGTLDYSPGLAPAAVGLTFALVAGALAWYITKKLLQREDEEIYEP